jgi:hypothetical protein
LLVPPSLLQNARLPVAALLRQTNLLVPASRPLLRKDVFSKSFATHIPPINTNGLKPVYSKASLNPSINRNGLRYIYPKVPPKPINTNKLKTEAQKVLEKPSIKPNGLEPVCSKATYLLRKGKLLTAEQCYRVFEADSNPYYGNIKAYLEPLLGQNAGKKMDHLADLLRDDSFSWQPPEGMEKTTVPKTKLLQDKETKEKFTLQYLGYGQFATTYKLMWEGCIYVLKVFRAAPLDIEKPTEWNKLTGLQKADAINQHAKKRLPYREVANGAFMNVKGVKATKLHVANPKGWTLMEFEDRNKISKHTGYTPAQIGCKMHDLYDKQGQLLDRNTINGRIVDHGGEYTKVPRRFRYSNRKLAALLRKRGFPKLNTGRVTVVPKATAKPSAGLGGFNILKNRDNFDIFFNVLA